MQICVSQQTRNVGKMKKSRKTATCPYNVNFKLNIVAIARI